MRSVRRLGKTSVAVAVFAAVPLAGAGAVTATGSPATSAATSPVASSGSRATTAGESSTCVLGNGVKHVVEIFFDNVHFNRDNPDVPSDLEMMPHLLDFIKRNGTLLSNNHTPLIAHTADDSITTYTGLYGDRAGMPISNSYQVYNRNGTTDPAGSFAYWTDPIYDTASTPTPGHDTHPSLVYSPVPPATASKPVAPNTEAPAPWVPFTRAGCNVGDVASANMELENVPFDLSKVFGPNSPEMKQYRADPDPYKDPETADYVGIAVHCARGAAFCADAKGVKYGEKSPTPTAVADRLPDEPGGYHGYQALFGHRYVAPQLGAGRAELKHHGYEVTNSSGNLVDLFGNQLNDSFTNGPGFPGFGSINAAQTLAYMADMQETGVPVTYGYIADIHGNSHIPGLKVCDNAPSALGSGSPCYVAQAQYYDASFERFFKRLAADGITSKNTLFVFSSDEGDHEAGANVGRAIHPSPAGCDGATIVGQTVVEDVPCHYPAGSFGELDGNLTGMLATKTGDKTPLSMESDTAPELYVTGQPGPRASAVRRLERDVASLKAVNPYSGKAPQKITNYLANPVEEGILHMVNADPARTPTLAAFAKPDYYLYDGGTTCSGPCVQQNTAYAWDHGDYAAEINNNWVGYVGPQVRNLGIDGFGPSKGPSSAGPRSGQETVPEQSAADPGPWVDETDIQPTMLFLVGLHDPYTPDGRVITQILDSVPTALRPATVQRLSACYKQVNSSVGDFGTDTLEASTAALESTSSGDRTYLATMRSLTRLERARDHLAEQVKNELFAAEVSNTAIPSSTARAQLGTCDSLLSSAAHLAS